MAAISSQYFSLGGGWIMMNVGTTRGDKSNWVFMRIFILITMLGDFRATWLIFHGHIDVKLIIMSQHGYTGTNR